MTSFINSNSKGYLIGTGTPDYKKSLGDYMTLQDVRNWYKDNIFKGTKQDISNRINNWFLTTLRWANDNKSDSEPLNSLCKKIIENYTLKMQNYEIYIKGTNQKKGRMPQFADIEYDSISKTYILKNLYVSSIQDIHSKLNIVSNSY